MFEYKDVTRLASVAKVAITEAEAEDIRQYLESAFGRADAALDAAEEYKKDGANAAEATDSDTGAVNSVAGAMDSGTVSADASEPPDATATHYSEMALTVGDLREDAPVRGTRMDLILEQSPAEGGDGFTIRRLVE